VRRTPRAEKHGVRDDRDGGQHRLDGGNRAGPHAAAGRDVDRPGRLAVDRRDAERVDRRFGDHETMAPLPFPAELEQGLAATRQRAFERWPTNFDVGDDVAGAVGVASRSVQNRTLASYAYDDPSSRRSSRGAARRTRRRFAILCPRRAGTAVPESL